MSPGPFPAFHGRTLKLKKSMVCVNIKFEKNWEEPGDVASSCSMQSTTSGRKEEVFGFISMGTCFAAARLSAALLV